MEKKCLRKIFNGKYFPFRATVCHRTLVKKNNRIWIWRQSVGGKHSSGKVNLSSNDSLSEKNGQAKYRSPYVLKVCLRRHWVSWWGIKKRANSNAGKGYKETNHRKQNYCIPGSWWRQNNFPYVELHCFCSPRRAFSTCTVSDLILT